MSRVSAESRASDRDVGIGEKILYGDSCYVTDVSSCGDDRALYLEVQEDCTHSSPKKPRHTVHISIDCYSARRAREVIRGWMGQPLQFIPLRRVGLEDVIRVQSADRCRNLGFLTIQFIEPLRFYYAGKRPSRVFLSVPSDDGP
jgi:hypothetical protein